MEPRLKIGIAIPLIVTAFYWKILTHQFSLILGYEGASQAYAWFHFLSASLRNGVWPMWDPFTFSGHSFLGEMQTGAFYPLNLLFVVLPFNRQGVFSPQSYHFFYIVTHILAAFLMYFLARELSLRRFAGLVAGICFSLGGFVAHVAEWPHLFGSAIWLPLLFALLLRAMKQELPRPAIAWAALSGLGLSMAVLAGGLHLVFMHALAAVGAVVYYTAATTRPGGRKQAWTRAALVLAAFFAFGIAGGAVQLFPSMEYSRQALRFLGPGALPATEKIPYLWMGGGIYPQALLGFLASGLTGEKASGEFINPYIGVFPLLLATIGVVNNWTNLWVRYLTGLAVAACVYSLGLLTPLHGLLYAITPWLWMAREADRFLYLADFSLAVLAGFGVNTLFSNVGLAATPGSLQRALRWVAIAAAAAIAYPAVLGHGDMNPWVSLSLVLIIASYGLFRFITRRPPGLWARFLVIAIIFIDLGAFDWSAANKLEVNAKHPAALDQLLSCQEAANFLRSRPGLFRVQLDGPQAPNMGDLFQVQTLQGSGVTLQMDYARILDQRDLLNARYILRPASATDAAPIYQDSSWKIFENAHAFPRAWMVHQTLVERDREKLFQRLRDPRVDLHRVALISERLDAALDPAPARDERVQIDHYGGNFFNMTVSSPASGLLVLSELYYPGWRASVNGKEARIWKVDGALRGIFMPAGANRVTFRYSPVSVFAGAAISLTAFGAGAFFFAAWLRRRKATAPVTEFAEIYLP